MARPTLTAIVAAVVDATAASSGWLLAVDGERLVVVAAAGGTPLTEHIGQHRPIAGTAGFVAGSGQPAALRVSAGDATNAGAGGGEGIPVSILAAPCGEEDILGVLEVVDKSAGTELFTIDDVEIVSLLARVAGAALGEVNGATVTVPSPEEMTTELGRLAMLDPSRYAAIAVMLQSVMGQS